MSRRGLIISLLFIIIFTSIASLPLFCQPSEDVFIDQDIFSFLGKEQYTTNDLVRAAQNVVDDRIKFFSGRAVVESPRAIFSCEGNSCELLRLETAIYVKTRCPLKNTFLNDNPYLNQTTEFVFDLVDERVTTISNNRRGTVEHRTDWANLTTSIEEVSSISAMEIAKHINGDNITFMMIVSRRPSYWVVRIYTDPGSLAESELHISYKNGSIISIHSVH